MKKSLIALAALAATASFAQSTATIYGTVDVGYQSLNLKGNKVSGINNNGAQTTQIHFKVEEDLGGGLKALFDSETDFNPVQAQGNTGFANSAANATASGAGSWMNSQTLVGVTGSMGELVGGVVNNQQLTAALTGQGLGTGIGSGYGSIIKAAALTSAGATSVVRFDNSIRYVSPAFNGFKVGGYYAAKQTKSNNAVPFSTTLGAYDRSGVQELSAMYNNGPLNAIVSQQTVDYKDVIAPAAASVFSTPVNGTTAASSAKVKMTSVAANYTVGAFTFGAINQTNKDDQATNAVNTSANLLSAKYVTGPHTVNVVTGELKNKIATGTGAGKKSTFTGVGYDYALSKSTSLYARYETLDDQAVTVAALTASGFTETTTKRNRTGLGMWIKF